MLEVSGVSFHYKDITALNKVSFTVRTGDRYAILGPNGSGKSTLFRILSTSVAPHAGEVKYFSGRSLPELRRLLGVLFQSPSLDKKLTALENWRHHGHLFGLRGKKLLHKMQETASRLDLSEVLERTVDKLSGGFQRRVELGKVLITDPQVLILDEPTAGLDPIARENFWNVLEQLRKEKNLTLIYSSHYFEEAGSADKVLLLDRGKVVAEGSPSSLSAELGHDLLRLNTDNPAGISEQLRTRFGLSPTARQGRVFADVSGARDRLGKIHEFLSDQSFQITLGKPTLEDVYFLKTASEVTC